jgi:hypothetical protein
MFFAAVTNIATICVGVVLVWGWVAFISEAIARRTGRTYAVPYPDKVLWASFGKFLLDLGLFGGVFALTQRLKGTLPESEQKISKAKLDQAGRCATATPSRGRPGFHSLSSSTCTEPTPCSIVQAERGKHYEKNQA